MKKFNLLLSLGIFAFGVSQSARAASPQTYYVSTSGNDSGSGSSTQPFRTIQRGSSILQPGDTLLVGPGTYTEALIDVIPSGRDWSAPVTIKALNAAQPPIVRPSSSQYAERVVQLQNFHGSAVHHIIIDGFVFDGSNVQWEVIKISLTAHDIRLLNSEAAYAPGSGIVIDYTSPGGNFLSGLNVHNNGKTDLDHGIYIAGSYNTVVNSTVYNNAGWGIHVYSSYGPISNDAIEANTCFDNARAGGYGAGIGLYSGANHTAIGNKVWGNHDGIFVDFGATNALVNGNTVYDNADYGIIIGSQAKSSMVKNNTLYSNPTETWDYSKSAVFQDNTIY